MTVAPHRYLRVEDLRRLRNVMFSSRRPVEGHYIGRHRSRQRGHSVEFNDYREYTPGDDVNALDWKVFGRSDRMYVKLFEHESDMTVTLLVDASASMAYAGVDGVPRGGVASWLERVPLAQRKRRAAKPVLRKYDYACQLAAAIAFLTTQQQDRVGFAAARDGLAEHYPPAATPIHLRRVLGAMENIEPTGAAKLADALDLLGQRTPRRGLLVVCSDFLEDREAIMKKLAGFRGRGADVILFHVMHPDELRLPDLDDAVFIDSESSQRLAMNVRDLREAYDARLHAFLDGWAVGCKRAGFDYNLVSTDRPYERALERYLFNRARTI